MQLLQFGDIYYARKLKLCYRLEVRNFKFENQITKCLEIILSLLFYFFTLNKKNYLGFYEIASYDNIKMLMSPKLFLYEYELYMTPVDKIIRIKYIPIY